MSKWAYGDDDCAFYDEPVDTREEAVEMIDNVYGSGYIGKVVDVLPFTVDAEHIIEKAKDDAYEIAGDASVNFLDKMSSEQINELTTELSKVFNDWLSRNGLAPTFYGVDDVERIEDASE